MKDIKNDLDITDSHISIALKTACNIIDKWGISDAEEYAILPIKKSDIDVIISRSFTGKTLSEDHKIRISYILNIHEKLRAIFSNPENVYGFIKLRNNNKPFNGLSPLEYILRNPESSLAEVDQHLCSLISN
jgi:hypothetical protein